MGYLEKLEQNIRFLNFDDFVNELDNTVDVKIVFRSKPSRGEMSFVNKDHFNIYKGVDSYICEINGSTRYMDKDELIGQLDWYKMAGWKVDTVSVKRS